MLQKLIFLKLLLVLLISAHTSLAQQKNSQDALIKTIQGSIDIKDSSPVVKSERNLSLLVSLQQWANVVISDYPPLVLKDTMLRYVDYPKNQNQVDMQIFSTFCDKKDSSYQIGVNISPTKSGTFISFKYDEWEKHGIFVPDTVCEKFYLIQEIYNDADRCNAITFLDSSYLKQKTGADAGAIYQIKLSSPFKGSFKKCMAVAMHNYSKGYFRLFYFYNENDEKIFNLIKSQMGWVRFLKN